MDLFSLFLFTHENNEIKPPTKINDLTVIQLCPRSQNCIFKYASSVGNQTLGL